MRHPSLRVLALLALGASACAHGEPAGRPPAPAAARYAVGAVVNRPHEVALPAHPGQLDATARFEVLAPSGAATTVLLFRRGDTLVARFRPLAAGEHRWRLLVGEGDAARVLARGAVVAEDLGEAGGVRVRGAALVDAAGRVFRPLGESRFNVQDPTWSDGLSIEGDLARMAADGMNTIRVVVVSACGKPGERAVPGCLEPRLGAFDEAAAARYDALFDAAERHDVKVVLSIFAVGFTPGGRWKGWESNPYARVRGGPARAPADFFVDPAAREAAKRRLRYALARWGASPALLAVELLNEPERDGGIPEADWIPWAQDLARTWRALDPYGHPVTLGSVGLHRDVEHDERPWWGSPECEIVQWHRHGKDVHDAHALARILVATIRDTARHGKPVLVGEFGWGGDPAPAHEHTHVGIWAATFAGAGVLAHTAPPATLDSDAPMTPARARHFRVLAAFLRRADPSGALRPGPDPEVSLPGARALALTGEFSTAIWVLGPPAPSGEPVTGLSLSIPGLAAGKWRATWVDDVTGKDLVTAEVHVEDGGGRVSVAAPPFSRHLALVVERLVR